ncbi:MAG: Co2+/Mg2+ efflux protein ApaG [Gammaproteobacteria bacterium]|nr:Co2+/Mg2+ efflux protein ApaG [Gammaproteobacteria bacterium]
MSDYYLPIAPIHIAVETYYLPEQSLPMQHRYTFAYQITLRNDGKEPMTLRRRYWQITDDNQKVEVVQGAGVVGQQPTLAPNEGFIYASGAQLSTPYGQMEGYYVFEDTQGHAYRAPIAPFLLSIPRTLH